jgi:hypothetical protein
MGLKLVTFLAFSFKKIIMQEKVDEGGACLVAEKVDCVNKRATNGPMP